MAPEIISAIQTIPPSAAATGLSRTNNQASRIASQNLQQAQKERQDAAQRTKDARAEEQQAQKNLQAAQAEERRAAEKVNAAQTERQQAARPEPARTSGKLISVVV